ncbi:MAG: MFS transporter [Anaerolineae bacterium]|nr:MFS transporter [Anaerolineae bacterium]
MSAANRATLPREQANFQHLVGDIFWFGLAFPAVSRFLSVYAIHLGANDTQLTLLASLPALILMLGSIVASRWLERFTNPRQASFLPALGHRMAFLLPALTPFMPQSFQVTWLILSLVIPALPQGVVSLTFLVMFRESVNGKTIPTLLSRRAMWFNIALAGSGLAMGFWLEHAPFPLSYQVMFVVAFLFSLVSTYHVMKVRVSDQPAQKQKDSGPTSWQAWRAPAFRPVAFAAILSHMTFFSIIAFAPLHLVNALGAAEGFMGIFGLVELIAAAVAAAFTSKIAASIGNRPMIAIGMLGTALSAFIIAAAPVLWVTLFAAAVGGAAWTMTTVGLFAYFSETTPAEHKAAYTTAYNQATFIAMFVGPFIGKLFNGMVPGESLVAVLMFGALLRMVAGILTYSHPREWVSRARQQLVASLR